VRIEALFLLGVAVFFGIVGAIYWFWAYEQGGTVMLIGTTLLGLLPGGYYFWWSRRMKPRPEDRPDATIEEGSGVIGSFPASSVWPFVLGMGLFLMVLSIAFGGWLIAPGIALVISSLVGVTAAPSDHRRRPGHDERPGARRGGHNRQRIPTPSPEPARHRVAVPGAEPELVISGVPPGTLPPSDDGCSLRPGNQRASTPPSTLGQLLAASRVGGRPLGGGTGGLERASAPDGARRLRHRGGGRLPHGAQAAAGGRSGVRGEWRQPEARVHDAALPGHRRLRHVHRAAEVDRHVAGPGG